MSKDTNMSRQRKRIQAGFTDAVVLWTSDSVLAAPLPIEHLTIPARQQGRPDLKPGTPSEERFPLSGGVEAISARELAPELATLAHARA